MCGVSPDGRQILNTLVEGTGSRPASRISRWAAEVAPTVAVEAVLAWLDAGQPDAEHAADRVRTAIMGVVEAAGRR